MSNFIPDGPAAKVLGLILGVASLAPAAAQSQPAFKPQVLPSGAITFTSFADKEVIGQIHAGAGGYTTGIHFIGGGTCSINGVNATFGLRGAEVSGDGAAMKKLADDFSVYRADMKLPDSASKLAADQNQILIDAAKIVDATQKCEKPIPGKIAPQGEAHVPAAAASSSAPAAHAPLLNLTAKDPAFDKGNRDGITYIVAPLPAGGSVSLQKTPEGTTQTALVAADNTVYKFVTDRNGVGSVEKTVGAEHTQAAALTGGFYGLQGALEQQLASPATTILPEVVSAATKILARDGKVSQPTPLIPTAKPPRPPGA